MLPDTATALWVAFFAVVPGYVAVSTFASRQKTWRGADSDLRTLLQALWVSAVIQIVAAPATLTKILPVRAHLDQHPLRVAIWGLLVVLVIPWVGGRTFALVVELRRGKEDPAGFWVGFFRNLVALPPAPTVWDWFFVTKPPDGAFVVVEFSDGKLVAGTFSEGSQAITSPEARGLFLAQGWVVDAVGNLVAAVPGSGGILIPNGEDVRSLRVLRSVDG
ncbi:MAG: hypothetical protein QOI39_4308 [Mycobacterium sp.]|jgi:hypothetical protein|nr:hypothetical protein [Mycobacterium sp.]